jgi:hypothetical protein
MPATVWMQAIAVTQATTIAPATSNSKDDRNIMTAHYSRNASNSRNKIDNRTANTVWMPTKAGMLLKSEMTTAAGTTASSWMSSVVGQQHSAGASATTAGTRNENIKQQQQRQ